MNIIWLCFERIGKCIMLERRWWRSIMFMVVKFDDNDNYDNEDICKSNIK